MPVKENQTGVLTNRQRPTPRTALKAIGWALTIRADPSPQASQPERPITGHDAGDRLDPRWLASSAMGVASIRTGCSACT